MAILVNEVEREERSFTRGITAFRIFQVSGVDNADAAEQAVAGATGVAFNSGHPQDSNLLAKRPVVTGDSHLFELRYEYVPRPSSGSDRAAERFPQIRWEVGNTTEQVDIDADGRPIINSAEDPFDPPPQRQFGTLFLRVITIEPQYDLIRALSFQNTCNADSFTILSYGSVQPGQCLCHSIQPTDSFSPGDTPLKIEYLFELRADGFDHRILDQGFNGYSQEDKGRIFTPAGEPVVSAVRLNGHGIPVESGFTIEGETPVGDSLILPPAQVETDPDTKSVWLRYRKYKRVSFAGLLSAASATTLAVPAGT